MQTKQTSKNNPFATFDILPNGNYLFPSWEAAIAYLDKYVHTNFRASRQEDGTTEVEIWKQ